MSFRISETLIMGFYFNNMKPTLYSEGPIERLNTGSISFGGSITAGHPLVYAVY
jgi:hypothetical protein